MKSGELNRRRTAPTDGLIGHPRRFISTTHHGALANSPRQLSHAASLYNPDEITAVYR